MNTPLLLNDISTPKLSDIMQAQPAVLSTETDLAEALNVLSAQPSNRVFCWVNGRDLRALTQAHCTQLLMAALQGFPVPKTLGEVAEPIADFFHRDTPLSEALIRLDGRMDQTLAVMHGDALIGSIGPEQWSKLMPSLLDQPSTMPTDPDLYHDELTGCRITVRIVCIWKWH